MNCNIKVVSFFAGCGGLDLGFEQAGFNVIWANDFEPQCRRTYVYNHNNTKFVLGDICKINPDTIPNCDGFIGGPPCQSWSVGGKQKGLDDERGQLFLKYIELINIKKPKFFLIENVKGMLDDKFKTVFVNFISRLDNAGYDVQWTLLDAVNFGIPQNRERVFIVGFQKDLKVKYTFPTPICLEPVTLSQAIGDITEEPNYYPHSTKICCNNIGNTNAHYQNHDVLASKFGSFYYRGNRRRGWTQPSFTINATAEFAPLHPSSPKMMYYGHQNWNFQKDKIGEYRRLSVRECARIQTFPDSFVFQYDDIKDAYRMIGNAVPPRLAKEIAKTILKSLMCSDYSEVLQTENKERVSIPILVGYYKGEKHKQLILANRLYYVRSDGRKGSVFKEDCSITPHFLLLHHKDNAEMYELDAEEPILADASFLKTLGFKTSGGTYLCFRLTNADPSKIQGYTLRPNHNLKTYSPYFTTIIKQD